MPGPKGVRIREGCLFLQNYENVSAEVWKINPSEDVVNAANTRGEPRGPAEQILYDCYVSSLKIRHMFDFSTTSYLDIVVLDN